MMNPDSRLEEKCWCFVKWVLCFLKAWVVVLLCDTFSYGQQVLPLKMIKVSTSGPVVTVGEIQKPGSVVHPSLRGITNLYFEREDRIWMASDDGLLMFDGIALESFFPAYRKEEEDRPALIHPISEGVFLLSYTSRKVVSNNATGIDLFDTRSRTFQPIPFPDAGKGVCWLLDFSERGISIFDRTGHSYILDFAKKKWMASRSFHVPKEFDYVAKYGEQVWGLVGEMREIWQLGAVSSRLWIRGVKTPISHQSNKWDISLGFRKANERGFELLRFDYGGVVQTITPLEHIEGSEQDNWNDIFVTPATKEIWVHHRGKGLLAAYNWSDGKQKLVLPIQDIIGNNRISLVATKANQIFVATNGAGLFWLKRHPSPLVDLRPALGSIRSFFSDGDSLLIGSYSGVYRMRGKVSPSSPPPVKVARWFAQVDISSDDATVYDFHKDEEGRIWMGLTSRLICVGKEDNAQSFTPPAGFACGDIWEIAPFDDTTLLLGSDAGVCLFDTKTGHWRSLGHKARNIPRTYGFIREPNASWLAYGEKGFFRLRFKSKQLVSAETAFPELGNPAVLFVFRESELSWWMGTREGLIHYNPVTGDFLEEDLLTCFKGREVYALYPDWKGNLWVSSDNGVFSIQSNRQSVFYYGAGYGLAETEFNRNAHCMLADGHLLFGNIAGVTQVLPELHEPTNPVLQVNTVVSTDADVRLVKEPGKKAVSIPRSVEGIFIDVEGLFTFSQGSRYAYRIPEQDSSWQVSSGRRIYINALPSGTWTLQLYRDIDGAWTRVPDMAFYKKAFSLSGEVLLVLLVFVLFLGILWVKRGTVLAVPGVPKTHLPSQATELLLPVVVPATPSQAIEPREKESAAKEEKSKEGEEHYWVRSFYELLEVQYKDPDLSVSKLASLLGISERTLFRVLKEMTGRTPNDCLQEFRLLKAHNAIAANPTKTISQVLFEAGFNTPSYFSRRFAERFGISPREFQKQHLLEKK